METRYTVRQTVEMTGVKSYVLRYWEEELELQIHRNELGFEESGAALLEGVAEDISEDAPTRAEEDINTEKRTDTVKAEIHNNEKILEFQTILERLIAQELRSQNEDEERCRSLDFAIRRQQMARREAAAASEKKGKRKHRDGVEKK